MQCHFCQSVIDDRASVCPTCRRDNGVPTALTAELAELVAKRNQLSEAVDAIKLKLGARG